MRFHPAQQVTHELLRGFYGEAVHGAGDIHYKYILPWWNDLGRDPVRGLQHRQEEILLLSFIKQQTGLYHIPGQPVFQDEVPVASGDLTLIQGDRSFGLALVLDPGLVGGYPEVLYGHACL